MPFFIPKDTASNRPAELPILDAGWLAYLDNAPSMIWIGDLQGRLLHVNDTWIRATGTDIRRYQAEHVWDLVHPEDRDRLKDLAVTLAEKPVLFEFRLRHADGSYRWVQENVRPWLDQNRRQLGFIGSVIDIQGQKDQEQYLAVLAMRQTSLTYFSRLIVEMNSPEQINSEALRLFCEHLSLPAAVLLLQDTEGGPTVIAATTGLGEGVVPQLAEHAAVGATLDYPEDVETFPLVHAWMSAQGWSEGVAVPLDPKAPELGCIIGLRSEPSAAPIGPLHYARDLVGVLGIAQTRHRTQSKLREGEERALQLQKMEAVGLLAGGVAHDFNNLLTAIRCFAELLRDDLQEAPVQRTRVDDILHAAGRASHLVRQLVAFSRQEISQPEPIDLNTLVDSLRGFIRSVLSEHVSIDVDLCTQPAWCRVDSRQLEQVIFNLCLNARDVMPTDGVLTLRVGCGTGEVDGRRRVRLSVGDTGSGIPPEVRAKLFQPFHSTKARGRGTGLGLATSLGIVRSFGGDLTYETEMGKGTVFHIDLPEIEDPLAEYSGSGAAYDADLRTPARARAHILLVEDDELVRSVTRMLAESLGHVVIAYGDSREAFQWAQAGALADIDILVTDIVMPGMNGHVLSKKLREIKPELKVFFMSGYVDDLVTLEAMAQPGVFFLPKPFSSDEFITKLAAALKAQE